jgi:uncharacterized protein YjbJ (UPF0337 family)
MNETKIEGVGQTLTGNVKEAVGNATGDRNLQNRGVADQVVGDFKQAAGSATDALANPGPMIDKAKAFAKDRPWTAAALVGTIGLALYNTLRGK